MEAVMDRDMQIQELRRDIAEIEDLICRWNDSTDAETLWAIELLEKCLARRKDVLAALSFQLRVGSGCQSGKRY
jgi:ribosomal protein L29